MLTTRASTSETRSDVLPVSAATSEPKNPTGIVVGFSFKSTVQTSPAPFNLQNEIQKFIAFVTTEAIDIQSSDLVIMCATTHPDCLRLSGLVSAVDSPRRLFTYTHESKQVNVCLLSEDLHEFFPVGFHRRFLDAMSCEQPGRWINTATQEQLEAYLKQCTDSARVVPVVAYIVEQRAQSRFASKADFTNRLKPEFSKICEKCLVSDAWNHLS